MFSDPIIAVIRTVVPAAVGSAIAWGIEKGIEVSDDTQAQLSAALVTVCISLYYILATFLERKVNPAFGWLLGSPKTPTYEHPETKPALPAEEGQ